MKVCWMAIESFRLSSNIPIFDGDQIFSITPKGTGGRPWNGNNNKGMGNKKKKSDSKGLHPFNNRNFFVTIWWLGCVWRWSKKFNHHMTNHHFSMVIAIFQSPTKGACQMFLESPIQKLMTRPLLWRLKSFSCHPMVGVCWMEIEFFLVAISHISIGDQKLWSPLNSGGVSNGDWIFFGHYLTQPHLQMVTKNFRSLHLLSIEIFFGHHRVQ